MRDRSQRARLQIVLRNLLGDQRGAAIIEAAVALPIMIVLSLGAIETARAVSAKASINHAAKETARFASVRGDASKDEATEATLESMALELAQLPPASLTASVSWNPDNRPGSTVLVQMQHTFTPVVPFMPSSFTLSSTASMIITR